MAKNILKHLPIALKRPTFFTANKLDSILNRKFLILFLLESITY